MLCKIHFKSHNKIMYAYYTRTHDILSEVRTSSFFNMGHGDWSTADVLNKM